MRRYEVQTQELVQVQCNQCGRLLRVENGIVKEGCYQAHRVFDYFSGHDGMTEEFDLCDACYEKLKNGFRIQPDSKEVTELL